MTHETLKRFADVFLQADHEYLEIHDDSFIYWPNKLAIEVSVTPLNGNHLKWRLQMTILREVTNVAAALEACSVLNKYTSSWSFVYLAEEQSVSAIAAYAGETSPHMLYMLSESAILMSWFSIRICEGLQHIIGGKSAYSMISEEIGYREIPDVTDAFLTARRSRPEWIFDSAPFIYPDVEDMVGVFWPDIQCERCESVGEVVVFESSRQSAGENRSYKTIAGFSNFDVYGWCYAANTKVVMHVPSEYTSSMANYLNVSAFRSADKSLLGCWQATNEEVWYLQKVTTSNLRGLAQGKRHEAPHHLYEEQRIALLAIDHIETELECLELTNFERAQETVVREQTNSTVALAVLVEAFEALEVMDVATDPQEGFPIANRAILSTPIFHRLFVSGVFNPMGPTVTEFSLIRFPDGSFGILHLQRHPLSPVFVCAARFADLSNLEFEFGTVLDKHLTYFPEMIMCQFGGQLDFESTNEMVTRAVVTRLTKLKLDREHEGHLSQNLTHLAHSLAKHAGDHWSRLGEGTAFEIEATTSRGSDESMLLFEAASNDENVIGFWIDITNAWDGALNHQKSQGSYNAFDTGKYALIYSLTGFIE